MTRDLLTRYYILKYAFGDAVFCLSDIEKTTDVKFRNSHLNSLHDEGLLVKEKIGLKTYWEVIDVAL